MAPLLGLVKVVEMARESVGLLARESGVELARGSGKALVSGTW